MRTHLLSRLRLRDRPPPYLLGLAVAAGGTALETLAIYPLGHLAPTVSLAVVYALTVVVTAVYWGTLPGLLTALAGALAFNYFHLPPVGRFTLDDARTWVAFASLAVVALMAGLLGNLARDRAADAEQRRREADLATELARVLPGGSRLDVALAVAGALAGKRVSPVGLGTMRTDNATFVVLLIGVIILVGALTFFPALLLGPVVQALTGHLYH